MLQETCQLEVGFASQRWSKWNNKRKKKSYRTVTHWGKKKTTTAIHACELTFVKTEKEINKLRENEVLT